MSATGAFATIILERLLDLVTVLLLLAAFVFVFDAGPRGAQTPAVFGAVKLGGAGRRRRSPSAALAVLFVLAGHPERLHGGC